MRKIIRAGILTLTLVFAFVFTAAAFAEGAAGKITQGPPITARHNYEKTDPVIDLNKHDITLKKGKSETLKAVIRPGGQSVSAIWITSNPNIAKVSSSGKVTAVAPGTAIISAGSLEYGGTYDQIGYSSVCYVTVNGDAKDAKPLGTSDRTYYYGKTKFTVPTGNYAAEIASIKKIIGGYTYTNDYIPGIGHFEGVYLGSNDIRNAHTNIRFLSTERGSIGFEYGANGKSLIKTSRGIVIGTKKSVVQQQYGLPTFEIEFTNMTDKKVYESYSYFVRTAGKDFYSSMTFHFLKSKGTVTLIAFYLGGDYNLK